MPRVLGSILLALVLLASLPANAQDFRTAEQADLVGGWELVPYPADLGGLFTNPTPPHQYFVVTSDGRINWLPSPENLPNASRREIQRYLETQQWNRYLVRDGKMTIVYTRISGLQELWTVRIVTKDFTAAGTDHRVGDLVMLRETKGQIDRHRLMRRLPE